METVPSTPGIKRTASRNQAPRQSALSHLPRLLLTTADFLLRAVFGGLRLVTAIICRQHSARIVRSVRRYSRWSVMEAAWVLGLSIRETKRGL